MVREEKINKALRIRRGFLTDIRQRIHFLETKNRREALEGEAHGTSQGKNEQMRFLKLAWRTIKVILNQRDICWDTTGGRMLWKQSETHWKSLLTY